MGRRGAFSPNIRTGPLAVSPSPGSDGTSGSRALWKRFLEGAVRSLSPPAPHRAVPKEWRGMDGPTSSWDACVRFELPLCVCDIRGDIGNDFVLFAGGSDAFGERSFARIGPGRDSARAPGLCRVCPGPIPGKSHHHGNSKGTPDASLLSTEQIRPRRVCTLASAFSSKTRASVAGKGDARTCPVSKHARRALGRPCPRIPAMFFIAWHCAPPNPRQMGTSGPQILFRNLWKRFREGTTKISAWPTDSWRTCPRTPR